MFRDGLEMAGNSAVTLLKRLCMVIIQVSPGCRTLCIGSYTWEIALKWQPLGGDAGGRDCMITFEVSWNRASHVSTVILGRQSSNGRLIGDYHGQDTLHGHCGFISWSWNVHHCATWHSTLYNRSILMIRLETILERKKMICFIYWSWKEWFACN